MEKSIIRAFKRLRVLTPNFKYQGSMDELVKDFNHALQETTCLEGRPYSGRSRRRRGRKRRSKCATSNGGSCNNSTCKHRVCFISEDSESSLDLSSVSNRYTRNSDVMKMEQEKCSHPSTLSDTDDLKIIHQFQQAISISQRNDNIGFSKNGGGVSVGESDSVNENFSPVRPNRRRRKCKRMAIDICPIEEQLQNTTAMKNPNDALSMPVCQFVMAGKSQITKSSPIALTCGKRKRTVRSLDMLEHCDIGVPPGISSTSGSNCNSQNSFMNNIESSVSSVSSSESDTDLLKRDECREADDEQSDFFHEPGPACGIPGIKTLWTVDRDDSEENDSKIEQLLNGCFDHFSLPAQNSYHYNLQRFNNIQKRDIRTGHRRLAATSSINAQSSSVTCIVDILTEFLQDPNQSILSLPPLNKSEKEQLLNLASLYLLKIKCEGRGLKKQAYLVKTSNTMQRFGASASSSSENSSSFYNNDVLGDIKRRKKISSEIVGECSLSTFEHNSSEKLPLNFQVCMSMESGSASALPIFTRSRIPFYGQSSTNCDQPMLG